ncbi:MFS transporter [Billgrantia azerbaijanica]|nr:MFS transporter [Halomonas azerbaijanica]
MQNKLLIAGLVLATLTIGADEYVLGPLLTPIGDDFDVEPTRVAWMVSTFALPYALLAPIFGALADRVGRKCVMITRLVVFAAATAGTALASTFAFGLTTRVLTGAAAAAVMPNIFACIGDVVAPDQQPQAMGRVQLGLTLGLILSPVVGAWMSEVFGWRAAFWLIACIALIAVLVLYRLLPGRSLTADAHIVKRTTTWVDTISSPGALIAIITMTLGLGIAVGTYALMGEMLRSRYGIGTATVGIIMAFLGLSTIIGNALVAPAFRLFGTPPRVILAGMVGTVTGIATITLVDALPLPLFVMASVVWLISGGCAAPSLQSYMATIGGENRGFLLAIGSSGLNIGIMLMTAIEGWFFSAYGRTLVGLVAVASIGLSVLLLARHQSLNDRPPVEDATENSV